MEEFRLSEGVMRVLSVRPKRRCNFAAGREEIPLSRIDMSGHSDAHRFAEATGLMDDRRV
ncbi:MAG TPA: hypothetical protein VMM15_09485 [Bradyrhizobium sp.]|nr:hypothetical protein [Bradyrhizobium sp.]